MGAGGIGQPVSPVGAGGHLAGEDAGSVGLRRPTALRHPPPRLTPRLPPNTPQPAVQLPGLELERRLQQVSLLLGAVGTKVEHAEAVSRAANAARVPGAATTCLGSKQSSAHGKARRKQSSVACSLDKTQGAAGLSGGRSWVDGVPHTLAHTRKQDFVLGLAWQAGP